MRNNTMEERKIGERRQGKEGQMENKGKMVDSNMTVSIIC